MLPRPPNQEPFSPSQTPSLDVRTVVILFHAGRLLLLKRAAWKKFAPNRWTGLGGKVEQGELSDLKTAALRELFEETDLSPDEVSNVRLRRTLFFHHPAEGLVCLLYFAGEARTIRIPSCNEGNLQWVAPDDVAALDVIENTARVLPLLVEDVQRDSQTVVCGLAHYDRAGNLAGITWE